MSPAAKFPCAGSSLNVDDDYLRWLEEEAASGPPEPTRRKRDVAPDHAPRHTQHLNETKSHLKRR